MKIIQVIVEKVAVWLNLKGDLKPAIEARMNKKSDVNYYLYLTGKLYRRE